MESKKISYCAYYSTVKEEYALGALEECAIAADDLETKLSEANKRIAELEIGLYNYKLIKPFFHDLCERFCEDYIDVHITTAITEIKNGIKKLQDPAALVKPIVWDEWTGVRCDAKLTNDISLVIMKKYIGWDNETKGYEVRLLCAGESCLDAAYYLGIGGDSLEAAKQAAQDWLVNFVRGVCGWEGEK